MAIHKPSRQLSGTNLRRHAGTLMRMSVKEGEAGTDRLLNCTRIPEGYPPFFDKLKATRSEAEREKGKEA